MNVLLTICARGGSKGIPGKNIRPLNGKPLLHYSIETARAFAQTLAYCTLALSTDDEKIRETAAAAGLRTDYLRPAALGSDTAGKIDVLSDLLKYEEDRAGMKFDYLVDLDVTSPLRTVEDLHAAFRKLREHDAALNIFSVSPAHRNPYFNMVEEREDGYVALAKRGNGSVILTRQSAPAVYDMNASFYIYRREFFASGQSSAITERSLAYPVPHTCFDLDSPLDFEIMEYLLREKKLDFIL